MLLLLLAVMVLAMSIHIYLSLLPTLPSSPSDSPPDTRESASPSPPPLKPSDITLVNFIYYELNLSNPSHIHDDYFLKQKKTRSLIYNTLSIPIALERFIFFGFMICLDSFLYLFTFLPLKFIVAIYGLFRWQWSCAWLFVWRRLSRIASGVGLSMSHAAQGSGGGPGYSEGFEGYSGGNTGYTNASLGSLRCDVLQGILWLISTAVMMTMIDTATLYHHIKGQAVIKLYVLFNVLEVIDRLCCSFGEDILDSLYITATSLKRKRDILKDFTVCIIYVCIHCLVHFYQVVTMNVAISSYNSALITVLMANNFVELKGAVFKKFETHNLFQISCSDVVERFKILVFLIVISIQKIPQMPSLNYKSILSEQSWIYGFLQDVALIVCMEFLVDWIKHMFITKFNKINPEVYVKFTKSLCNDLTSHSRVNTVADNSLMSRRIGFVALPLGAMVMRVYLQWWTRTSQELGYSNPSFILLNLLIALVLWSLKILVSIRMLGYAIQTSMGSEGDEEGLSSTSDAFHNTYGGSRDKGLDKVERYAIYGKVVP